MASLSMTESVNQLIQSRYHQQRKELTAFHEGFREIRRLNFTFGALVSTPTLAAPTLSDFGLYLGKVYACSWTVSFSCTVRSLSWTVSKSVLSTSISLIWIMMSLAFLYSSWIALTGPAVTLDGVSFSCLCFALLEVLRVVLIFFMLEETKPKAIDDIVPHNCQNIFSSQIQTVYNIIRIRIIQMIDRNFRHSLPSLTRNMRDQIFHFEFSLILNPITYVFELISLHTTTL